MLDMFKVVIMMTLACEKDRLLTEFLLMKMTLLENQPHFRSACCADNSAMKKNHLAV